MNPESISTVHGIRPDTMNTRPTVRPRPYSWKAQDRTETPGIALWGKSGLAAHLTPTEARTLADRLHDLADLFN